VFLNNDRLRLFETFQIAIQKVHYNCFMAQL